MKYIKTIQKTGNSIRNILMCGLFAFLPAVAFAQEEYDEYDDDEEEDEISLTDEDVVEGDIEVPEALTNEVDSLLQLYYSQMYLTPDGDCNYRDENPEYSDEEYISRLSRLPNIMEMPYNQVVRKFIDRYATRLRRSVGFWLGASNFYMPIFEQALETYNMPLELRYLPVIESGLNPNAVSRVGATGLWQFMLATGKQYGLKVNSLVDERRDPIKASYAAARYLRDLYKIFGDWNLVIAAYNCGPENINRAIHRAGGERDYWKIYPYLPSETRGYVPAFIAANYIMNYYCEHNICPMRTQLPAKSDTVVVTRDVHLQQIAAVCNIPIEELRTLNPQYRRDLVNGSTEPSTIRLTDASINTFIDNEDSVYAYNADQLLTRRMEVSVEDVQEVARPTTTYSRRSASYNKRGRHVRESRGRKGRSQEVKGKRGKSRSSVSRKENASASKHHKRSSSKSSSKSSNKSSKSKSGKKKRR